MHRTMVVNESAKPTKKHLMELANYFKVKNASKIIDDVQSVISNWKFYADQCDVNKVSKKKYTGLLMGKINEKGNVFGLAEVGELEVQIFNLAPKFISSTILKYSKKAPILATPC
jgi:hypothetical protein